MSRAQFGIDNTLAHGSSSLDDASTHLEQELAPEMGRLAQSMGVGGLRQVIEPELAFRPLCS